MDLDCFRSASGFEPSQSLEKLEITLQFQSVVSRAHEHQAAQRSLQTGIAAPEPSAYRPASEAHAHSEMRWMRTTGVRGGRNGIGPRTTRRHPPLESQRGCQTFEACPIDKQNHKTSRFDTALHSNSVGRKCSAKDLES